MDDPPSRDYWLSVARRVRSLDDDRAAEFLEQEYARRTTPAVSVPGAPNRTRRTRRPPVALLKGLTLINRIREDAAAAIRTCDLRQAAREGVTLAPANLVRRRRDGSGYALPRRYRGAAGIIHEPAFLLMDLDAAGGRALESWDTTGAGSSSVPASPVPALSPGTALVVGALFRLIQFPFVAGDAERLLRSAATLKIHRDLVKLAAALVKHPGWCTRIRRCDYAGGQTEGCYRYFPDRSPEGNARGCCRSHAVRLAEAGARKRYRPRKPSPRRRSP